MAISINTNIFPMFITCAEKMTVFVMISLRPGARSCRGSAPDDDLRYLVKQAVAAGLASDVASSRTRRCGYMAYRGCIRAYARTWKSPTRLALPPTRFSKRGPIALVTQAVADFTANRNCRHALFEVSSASEYRAGYSRHLADLLRTCPPAAAATPACTLVVGQGRGECVRHSESPAPFPVVTNRLGAWHYPARGPPGPVDAYAGARRERKTVIRNLR